MNYILKRFLLMIPTLFGITLLCFSLLHLTPGGPVELAIASLRGAHGSSDSVSGRSAEITDEQRQAIREYYGFDKPLLTRYTTWMGKIFRLDLGESYFTGEKVWDMIRRCLPVSMSLGLFSFFIIYAVCIPLGILKAVKHQSRFDVVSSGILFFLYSIPSFALGILLIVLFCGGSFWNLFPIEGLVTEGSEDWPVGQRLLDYLHHLVLPLTCYTVGSFAMLTFLVKNSLLEQLSQDYILTARAKGVSEKVVVLKHALRNALLPLAHNLGGWLTVFFSGSILIETIFGLQGIGRLSYDAILHRDYPVVLADIVILAGLSTLGNLLSDILYVLIDPRVEYGSV